MLRLGLALAAFLTFTTYSFFVVANHGALGFLDLLATEGWSRQVFLDLVIAIVIGGGWMLRDAKQRGLRGWPFALGSLAAGSIALLAYLVWREWRQVVATRT